MRMDGPPWILLGYIAMKMLSIYWRASGRTVFRTPSRQDHCPLTRCVVLYRCFVLLFSLSQAPPSPLRLQTWPLNQPRSQSCEHPLSPYTPPLIIVADHEHKSLPRSCGASLQCGPIPLICPSYRYHLARRPKSGVYSKVVCKNQEIEVQKTGNHTWTPAQPQYGVVSSLMYMAEMRMRVQRCFCDFRDARGDLQVASPPLYVSLRSPPESTDNHLDTEDQGSRRKLIKPKPHSYSKATSSIKLSTAPKDNPARRFPAIFARPAHGQQEATVSTRSTSTQATSSMSSRAFQSTSSRTSHSNMFSWKSTRAIPRSPMTSAIEKHPSVESLLNMWEPDGSLKPSAFSNTPPGEQKRERQFAFSEPK
jgi:hypothetical protein